MTKVTSRVREVAVDEVEEFLWGYLPDYMGNKEMREISGTVVDKVLHILYLGDKVKEYEDDRERDGNA
jgi:hypothetical protein